MNTSTCHVERIAPDELILEVAQDTHRLRLRLTRVLEHTWRLQSANDQKRFDDMGAAQTLARDLGEAPPAAALSFLTSEDHSLVTAENGEDRICITKSPFTIRLFRGANCLTEITDITNQGNTLTVDGVLSDQEALFGGGERFNQVNQRGKRLDVMAIDRWCQTEGNSYVPIPFVISSRGYALFLNRYERSVMDLGETAAAAWQLCQHDAPLDLYLFQHRNPYDTLCAYSLLTGFAPMPAGWMFGIQSTRHERLGEYGTVEGIAAMINMMAENDLPWDAIIIEGWKAYDVSTYAELKQAVDMVHSLGKKILVYSECGRVPYSDDPAIQGKINAELGCKPEYLIHEPDGNTRLPETAAYNPADMPNPRRSQFVDLTNPEAMRWWFDVVWGRLVKELGIDGSKIDFCEQVPDYLPLDFADGRRADGAHHWYPTLYNARMYRFFSEQRPEGGMCLSRGGGIGAQRYPFLWAGDQLREWRFLQAILTSILSSGLSGLPFMSYDLAGYLPSQLPEDNPEERVFIRGAQMGCFSSNMQTHGTVTRPYDFDPWVKDIYRVYCKLHQALRPYLTEQAETAVKTGAPLMRHLFLYDPQDETVYGIDDEYMLGDALLVAPVLTGAEERDIYLPRGDWTHLRSGQSFKGGQTLAHFSAPLAQIPVFVRSGHSSGALDNVMDELLTLLSDLS